MDHPFLNPSDLTDDQLMDRIQKCHRILSGEIAMGHASVVDSARQALETYQFEWNERMRTQALGDKFRPDQEKQDADGPLEFGVVKEYYTPEDNQVKVERPDEDKE